MIRCIDGAAARRAVAAPRVYGATLKFRVNGLPLRLDHNHRGEVSGRKEAQVIHHKGAHRGGNNESNDSRRR